MERVHAPQVSGPQSVLWIIVCCHQFVSLITVYVSNQSDTMLWLASMQACLRNASQISELRQLQQSQRGLLEPADVNNTAYQAALCAAGYFGNLCGECEAGYAKHHTRCVKCPHRAVSILGYILSRVFEAGLVLAVLTLWLACMAEESSMVKHPVATNSDNLTLPNTVADATHAINADGSDPTSLNHSTVDAPDLIADADQAVDAYGADVPLAHMPDDISIQSSLTLDSLSSHISLDDMYVSWDPRTNANMPALELLDSTSSQAVSVSMLDLVRTSQIKFSSPDDSSVYQTRRTPIPADPSSASASFALDLHEVAPAHVASGSGALTQDVLSLEARSIWGHAAHVALGLAEEDDQAQALCCNGLAQGSQASTAVLPAESATTTEADQPCLSSAPGTVSMDPPSVPSLITSTSSSVVPWTARCNTSDPERGHQVPAASSMQGHWTGCAPLYQYGAMSARPLTPLQQHLLQHSAHQAVSDPRSTSAPLPAHLTGLPTSLCCAEAPQPSFTLYPGLNQTCMPLFQSLHSSVGLTTPSCFMFSNSCNPPEDHHHHGLAAAASSDLRTHDNFRRGDDISGPSQYNPILSGSVDAAGDEAQHSKQQPGGQSSAGAGGGGGGAVHPALEGAIWDMHMRAMGSSNDASTAALQEKQSLGSPLHQLMILVLMLLDLLQMAALLSWASVQWVWPDLLWILLGNVPFLPLSSMQWAPLGCAAGPNMPHIHLAGLQALLSLLLPVVYAAIAFLAARPVLKRLLRHQSAPLCSTPSNLKLVIIAVASTMVLWLPYITYQVLGLFACSNIDGQPSLPGEFAAAQGSYWQAATSSVCLHGAHLGWAMPVGMLGLLLLFGWLVLLLMAALYADGRCTCWVNTKWARSLWVDPKQAAASLTQLTKGSTPGSTHWVLLPVFKMICCVSVVVFMWSLGSEVQLYSLWAIITLCLILQMAVAPYHHWWFNLIHVSLLVAQLLLVYLCLGYSGMGQVGLNGFMPYALEILMLLVIVGAVGIMAWHIAKLLKLVLQHKS